MLNTRIATEAVPNFPTTQLDRVNYEAIVRTPARISDEARWEAVAAFYAATYRHRAARDSADALMPLLSRAAQATEGWRYKTQTRLFEFIVSLNSAFESSAYGLYFLGAVIDPANFPFVEEHKYWNIKLKTTAKAYQAAWPGEPLTLALVALLDAPDYKTLLDRRNVLAHRIAPGFEFRLGPGEGATGDPEEQGYAVAWLGEPLSALIPQTLARAEELLTELWTAAEEFAVNHSQEFRAT